MAVLTDIADAVVAELEGATLSQTPTVERVFVPSYDRAKVSGLRIYVVATGQAISDFTRGSDEFDYTVRLGIYKPVTLAAMTTECDAMVAFVEEVIDLFRSNDRLTSYADAALVGISNEPAYDPAQLDQHHVFVSLVTLTYRLVR